MDKDGYQWWIERFLRELQDLRHRADRPLRGLSLTFGKSLLDQIQQHQVNGLKVPATNSSRAAVKEELGDLNIIAEDLGQDDEVIELRERTGFQE